MGEQLITHACVHGLWGALFRCIESKTRWLPLVPPRLFPTTRSSPFITRNRLNNLPSNTRHNRCGHTRRVLCTLIAQAAEENGSALDVKEQVAGSSCTAAQQHNKPTSAWKAQLDEPTQSFLERYSFLILGYHKETYGLCFVFWVVVVCLVLLLGV